MIPLRSKKRRASDRSAPALPAFDLREFLDSAGVQRKIAKCARSAVVFSQGNPAEEVYYIQQGSVKISVLSRTGKEAVVAILGARDFFGEGCLAGQPRRMSTASAMSATTLMVVEKSKMQELLHNEPTLADRFLTHMLARNIKIEEDLVDQLFNSSEKRLARTLLLLARYGKEDQPLRLPKMSQETLAERRRASEQPSPMHFPTSARRRNARTASIELHTTSANGVRAMRSSAASPLTSSRRRAPNARRHSRNADAQAPRCETQSRN